MNRYCEIKLNDVLKTAKSETFINRRKTTVVKRNVDSMGLLKRKKDCDDTDDLSDTRRSRITKLNTSKRSKFLPQDVNLESGNLRMVSKPKTDDITGKHKRHDDKIRNTREQCNKTVHSPKSNHTELCNNSDTKITKRRKRKRKSRESCWENKLTGAKRVSKRLSNLRMEKQKSMRNLEYSLDVPQISIKSRQPITFSGRCKMKPDKELYGKSSKSRKASYRRNDPEVQFNFGKLSHTKRLYPKIAAGRRPASYTITIKPTSSFQKSPSKRNEDVLGEDIDDCDVNSLITNYVEDIENEILNEIECEELSDMDKTDVQKIKTIEEADFEPIKEESNVVEVVSQESKVQNLVCDVVEENYHEGSTIVVDIDSGEGVDYGSLEEITRNEEITVSDIEDCKAVPEEVTVIDSKQDENEEKTNTKGEDLQNINISKIDTKQDISTNESTPVESNVDSTMSEDVEIENAED